MSSLKPPAAWVHSARLDLPRKQYAQQASTVLTCLSKSCAKRGLTALLGRLQKRHVQWDRIAPMPPRYSPAAWARSARFGRRWKWLAQRASTAWTRSRKLRALQDPTALWEQPRRLCAHLVRTVLKVRLWRTTVREASFAPTPRPKSSALPETIALLGQPLRSLVPQDHTVLLGLLCRLYAHLERSLHATF